MPALDHEEIVVQLAKILRGVPREHQACVIADVVAIFLAGCAPEKREFLLAMHVKAVRELIPINEDMLFGEAGHPAGGHEKAVH